jgi:hypothetical protein
MKKIVFLALVLPMIIFSCKKTPEAFFHTDNADPEVGQEVFFINDSKDGDRFEWDFGDGFISEEENPVHIFTGTGSYQVSLIVYSKSGDSDEAVMTINVMIPTLLEVEVVEYFDEYVVPNASIVLYPTLPDLDAERNSVAEAITDADGFAVFSHLDPFVYYADVWETDHDNYTLRDEDVAFIRTPEIIPHKINRFLAYVDFVDHSKGEKSRERSFVIRKIVRKAEDKNAISSGSGISDWQELYKRSIKLK